MSRLLLIIAAALVFVATQAQAAEVSYVLDTPGVT